MKIVVCVKQVPATTEVSIDSKTKRLNREGVSIEMNLFDTYALEQGILLREKHGGEVIVLSMGLKRAEVTKRDSIACGLALPKDVHVEILKKDWCSML